MFFFIDYSSTTSKAHNPKEPKKNGVLNLKTTEELTIKPTVKFPFLRRVKAVIIEGRVFSAVKRRLKPMVVAFGKSALRRPWIKRSALAVLNLSPHLKNSLYRLVWKDIALPPRAMRIYTALSTAIPTHSAPQITINSKGHE